MSFLFGFFFGAILTIMVLGVCAIIAEDEERSEEMYKEWKDVDHSKRN